MTTPPLISVLMGSKSDWPVMSHTATTLDELGAPYETRVISAHRNPELLDEYVAQAPGRGVEIFIAAAGGAAHLAGVIAARSELPVLGVPMESKLHGVDSLLSIVQMPAGVPVGTLGIAKAGAINAALLAATILGAKHPPLREAYSQYRKRLTKRGLSNLDPAVES